MVLKVKSPSRPSGRRCLYRVAVCMVVVLTIFCACAEATDYYVDAEAGDDGNSGLVPEAAWRSLEKVNATTFLPGDRILLKRGTAWIGTLSPKGSGVIGNPIRLGAYGDGPAPLLDGAGAEDAGVFELHNQEHWEVRDLELTNDAPAAGRRHGVLVTASNAGTLRHIYLSNLKIHHVKGIAGQSNAAKNTGGIGINVLADDIQDTRFEDILIEDCTISTIDNTGIYTATSAGGANTPGTANFARRHFSNLRIRNNRINDIAKNAMIIRLTDATCVVEHNVCWDTCMRVETGNTIFSRSADGTVFQYNEGFLNRSKDFDGSLYDADLESYNCVFQYSYSHDNAHGLIWFASEPEDTGTIVRYCISQNDRGIIFALRSTFGRAMFYNNVVYVPAWLSPTIIQERGNATFTYGFYNNIVYNLSPTAKYEFGKGKRDIDSNLFFGLHPDSEPDDANKITADPKFLEPGKGAVGLDTLDGYRLQTGSPAIDTGRKVDGAHATDFWGNLVSAGSDPDRGVHEVPR